MYNSLANFLSEPRKNNKEPPGRNLEALQKAKEALQKAEEALQQNLEAPSPGRGVKKDANLSAGIPFIEI